MQSYLIIYMEQWIKICTVFRSITRENVKTGNENRIHEHNTEQKNESMKFVGKRMKLEKTKQNRKKKQKSNKQNPLMNPHKHRK